MAAKSVAQLALSVEERRERALRVRALDERLKLLEQQLAQAQGMLPAMVREVAEIRAVIDQNTSMSTPAEEGE